MSQTGSPITSTTYQQARAKVSDGKSVRVSVPANSGDIAAGQICYFGGFLGFAMTDLTNSATAAQDLILQIGIAEYETDVIDTSKTFAAGTKIYWDDTEKELTETATDVFAGVVTSAKDDNDVIWFILTPGIVNSAETDVIGDLTDLDTTDKTSAVDAINEVNTNADAANTAIGTLTSLTTTEKTNLVGAINEVDADVTTALARVAANVTCAADAEAAAVRTALIALLTALETAGLMAGAGD
jgi:hypothetical protein